MPLADFHVSRPTSSGHVRVQVDRFTAVEFSAAEQEQLLESLARIRGYVLVDKEAPKIPEAPKKPVAEAIRVARYLEGRRTMLGLDPELIHGVGIQREDEQRWLTVSDLQALLDYVREA